MRKPFYLLKLILILTVLFTASVKPLLVDAHNIHSNFVVTIRYGLSHSSPQQRPDHYTTLSKAFKNNDREKNDIVCLSVPLKKELLKTAPAFARTVPVSLSQAVPLQFQVLRI